MNPLHHLHLLSLALLLAFATPALAEPLEIFPGSNNEPITSVLLKDGKRVISQNAPAGEKIFPRSRPVTLLTVGLANGRTLDTFTFGQRVVLRDYAQWQLRHSTGIGVVLANGNRVRLRPGQETKFGRALTAVFNNTNLTNYWYDDFSEMWEQEPRLPVLDMIWPRGFLADAYLVVAERAGNSVVEIEALDASGQQIAGTRRLSFGYEYDWDTGYSNRRYYSSQSLWLTAVALDKFFQDTGVAPREIHGLRFYNNSEADVKVLLGTAK